MVERTRRKIAPQAAMSTTILPAAVRSSTDVTRGAAAFRYARERHLGVTFAELILRQEYEVGAIGAGGHCNGAVRFSPHIAIDHFRKMRGILGRLRRSDQHLPKPLRAIGVLHQFGNPHRLARLVLAREDAHAAR